MNMTSFAHKFNIGDKVVADTNKEEILTVIEINVEVFNGGRTIVYYWLRNNKAYSLSKKLNEGRLSRYKEPENTFFLNAADFTNWFNKYGTYEFDKELSKVIIRICDDHDCSLGYDKFNQLIMKDRVDTITSSMTLFEIWRQVKDWVDEALDEYYQCRIDLAGRITSHKDVVVRQIIEINEKIKQLHTDQEILDDMYNQCFKVGV